MVTMIHVPTNILLVDDEKDFVEMLSMRLEDAGDKVTPAYDGSMCLEKLKETPIDVIILDIKMPGMDGIQALREIKSRYPLIEVILLTGHGTTETAVQGMKLGAFRLPPETGRFRRFENHFGSGQETKGRTR
jgi:DNA-binding NtrC family response regulator